MKSKLIFTSVAVLAALSLVVAACGSDDDESSDPTTTTEAPAPTMAPTTTAAPAPTTTMAPTTTAAPAPAPVATAASCVEDDTLKLGYILPSTGALAYINEPMAKAVELAVEEIGDAGIQGIEMVAGDSGTSADVASTTADSHLAEGVQGIVGAAASGISLSIIDKITGAGIPMISPSNTDHRLTTYNDNDLYFRTVTSDNLQGRVMGDLVADDGNRSAMILYRNDSYGRGFAEATERQIIDSGLESAGRLALDIDGSTYTAEVQEVVAAGVDAVILVAFAEGGRVIAQMIEAGITPENTNIYTPDGMASDETWEQVDPDDPSVVQGIRGTRPVPTEGAEVTFSDRFAEFAPGVDTLFASQTYDAVIIYALASLAACSTQASDFAPMINDVTRGGTKCSLYADCAQMLMEGTDIDYDGASGPLDFVDAGEPGVGTYELWEFDADGKVQPFETRTLS